MHSHLDRQCFRVVGLKICWRCRSKSTRLATSSALNEFRESPCYSISRPPFPSLNPRFEFFLGSNNKSEHNLPVSRCQSNPRPENSSRPSNPGVFSVAFPNFGGQYCCLEAARSCGRTPFGKFGICTSNHKGLAPCLLTTASAPSTLDRSQIQRCGRGVKTPA